MKGWVDLGATQSFWIRDPWIGNLAPNVIRHSEITYGLFVKLSYILAESFVIRFITMVMFDTSDGIFQFLSNHSFHGTSKSDT